MCVPRPSKFTPTRFFFSGIEIFRWLVRSIPYQFSNKWIQSTKMHLIGHRLKLQIQTKFYCICYHSVAKSVDYTTATWTYLPTTFLPQGFWMAVYLRASLFIVVYVLTYSLTHTEAVNVHAHGRSACTAGSRALKLSLYFIGRAYKSKASASQILEALHTLIHAGVMYKMRIPAYPFPCTWLAGSFS